MTQGFAKRARELGARVVEGVEVTAIDVAGGKVRGVRTTQGDISAPIVINAAGPTAARVGRLAGVSVAVCPRRRHIFFTEPFPELAGAGAASPTIRPAAASTSWEMEQVLLSPGDVEDIGQDQGGADGLG